MRPFASAVPSANLVQMARRGPRTSEGKAASSRNALKHGLSAGDPVVRQVEDAEDWQRHLEQVISSIEP